LYKKLRPPEDVQPELRQLMRVKDAASCLVFRKNNNDKEEEQEEDRDR
jgi:hypothetical protein